MGSHGGCNRGSKACRFLKTMEKNDLETALPEEELGGGGEGAVDHLRTCGSSKVDTEEEGQKNNGTQRDGLHGPWAWALHRCLLNSSYLVFYEAVQYLKKSPENFVVENKVLSVYVGVGVGFGSPGIRIMDGCKPPDVGPENRI